MSEKASMLLQVGAIDGAELVGAAPVADKSLVTAFAFKQCSPRVDAEFSAVPYHVIEITTGGWQRYDEWRASGSAPRKVEHCAGDSVFYPAGMDLALRGRSDADVVLVTVDPAVMQATSEQTLGTWYEPVTKARSPRLVQLALNFVAPNKRRRLPCSTEELELDLAFVVARDFGAHRTASELANALSPKVLRRVLDFMRDNLAEPCALTTLARVAGLSKFHFVRVFRLATGHSPHQMLLAMRLNHARWLLSRSGTDLAQIAYDLGFSSQAHFTTAFSRAHGITPSVYRSLFRTRTSVHVSDSKTRSLHSESARAGVCHGRAHGAPWHSASFVGPG